MRLHVSQHLLRFTCPQPVSTIVRPRIYLRRVHNALSHIINQFSCPQLPRCVTAALVIEKLRSHCRTILVLFRSVCLAGLPFILPILRLWDSNKSLRFSGSFVVDRARNSPGHRVDIRPSFISQQGLFPGPNLSLSDTLLRPGGTGVAGGVNPSCLSWF